MRAETTIDVKVCSCEGSCCTDDKPEEGCCDDTCCAAATADETPALAG